MPIGTARRAPPDDVTGPAGGGKGGATDHLHRGSGQTGAHAHGAAFTHGITLSRSRDTTWFGRIPAEFG